MDTNGREFTIREAPCIACKHLLGFPYCEAFPDGIPEDIQNGENQHDYPYPGDNGIQFEMLPTKPDTSDQAAIGLDKLKRMKRKKG